MTTLTPVKRCNNGGSMKRYFYFAAVLLTVLLVLPSGYAQEMDIAEYKRLATESNKNYAPWDPADIDKLRKEVGLIGPGPQNPYPTPRFPDYLKKPSSEEMMPQSLAAVAQKGGRTPLGLADPGDIVLIVVPFDAEPLIQQAMIKAYASRKVEARIIYENELVGVTKEDMQALTDAKNLFKAGDGQQESAYFFEFLGAWPDFNVYKDWVKENDPVYYHAAWPEVDYPNEKLKQLAESYERSVSDAVVAYLDEHPEVNKVFFRTGGRTNTRSTLKHQGKKFIGNYTYMNHYDLMSKVPNVPADVWRMLEGKIIDPLGFVDRYEISDPEGTVLWGDVSSNDARTWAEGSYQQGHLYMLPSQSSGRYPYSRINYPAIGNDWIEPVQTNTHGIVASTNSHATNHARIEIHLKEGYIDKVVGGGLYGDGMRVSLKYPNINDALWPYQKKPGFWWLYEAGTGTNPKYFKHPAEILTGQNLSERNAGGVIHWSFGTEIQNGPEPGNTMMSPVSLKFAEDNQLPVGHGMHHHTLLPTFQVRLRDTGNWVTLIEHGIVQTYYDPEVRALSSRYGNPDELLRRDWVPELPGITMPGNYDKDYAADPGTFWVNWANSIQDGTNEYLGK
jgi:hypothetical protein